ncbi:hypothetical protein AAFF_G00248130 [Aldrovandia affinis]|uniref:Uncharacterized protein n=1 Tax=Aldrovandia affinis TaxID=143900 RepID=A0AAD7RD71_9TELE|nr:hypothetical protein AAFF_G00248130 [Aldrovandia affinis]
MTTAESLIESFSVWSHLLVEGYNVLSREDTMDLVHVEDVFEPLRQLKQDLEVRMCSSLHEKDTTISHVQAALDVRCEGLEVHTSSVLKVNSVLLAVANRNLEHSAELMEYLLEAKENTARKQLLLVELKAKLEEQDTEVQNLTTALEEKDHELQTVQALRVRRAWELRTVNAVFKTAVQELEDNTSQVFEENDRAISQLQEALHEKTEDLEDLWKLLLEAKEEVACKKVLLSDRDVKLHEQDTKVQNLTTALGKKDRELQAMQKRRELELQNVRDNFEKAVQALEANTSLVLKENDQAISQLQETLNKTTEDLEDLWKLLLQAKEEVARKEVLLSDCDVKLDEQDTKVQNLTTALEEKDRELQESMSGCIELRVNSSQQLQDAKQLGSEEESWKEVSEATQEGHGKRSLLCAQGETLTQHDLEEIVAELQDLRWCVEMLQVSGHLYREGAAVEAGKTPVMEEGSERQREMPPTSPSLEATVEQTDQTPERAQDQCCPLVAHFRSDSTQDEGRAAHSDVFKGNPSLKEELTKMRRAQISFKLKRRSINM